MTAGGSQPAMADADNDGGTEQHQAIQVLVARFVDDELLPLEPMLLDRNARGEALLLTDAELAPLLRRARD